MPTLALLAELAADERAVVIGIVLARLFVPLLIPRYPLVIIAALVIDAADNSILAMFTEIDTGPDGPYQSFDKALDIYYLAIAYLAAMRNWTSDAAFRIAQFLLYYRLVGTMLFELTGERSLLLIFPNTFEYFFIAYELIRLRFRPERFPARFWLLLAAGIWVLVKLPQEYWIHVAQRDFTDTIRENPTVGVVCALVVLGLLACALLWVRPRLPAPDWGWRVAADPIPEELADAPERQAYRLAKGRILWDELLEKAALLALLGAIFASILPRIDASVLETALVALAIVAANTAISTWFARREATIESAARRFGALLAMNLFLVWIASFFVGGGGDFPFTEGLFFAFLVNLVIWLYDVYKPVYDLRFADSPLRVRSARDLWSASTPPSHPPRSTL
jgi:hypothetical protein